MATTDKRAARGNGTMIDKQPKCRNCGTPLDGHPKYWPINHRCPVEEGAKALVVGDGVVTSSMLHTTRRVLDAATGDSSQDLWRDQRETDRLAERERLREIVRRQRNKAMNMWAELWPDTESGRAERFGWQCRKEACDAILAELEGGGKPDNEPDLDSTSQSAMREASPRCSGEDESEWRETVPGVPSPQQRRAGGNMTGYDEHKLYLGDGVYATFDGFHVILTVEDGIAVTNRIFLDPSVYTGLVRYVESLKAASAVERGERRQA